MDETKDISGRGQLSIPIRWAPSDCTRHENFIGIQGCTCTDAKSKTDIILSTSLTSRCVAIKKTQGRNYDGASVLRRNMSGERIKM